MASNSFQASSKDVIERHHQALVTGLESHLTAVVQEASKELLEDELKSRLLDESVDLSQRIEELLSRIKSNEGSLNLFCQFVAILRTVGLSDLARKLDEYWLPHKGETDSVPVKSKPTEDFSNVNSSEISYSNEALWGSSHHESLVPCVSEQSKGMPTFSIHISNPDPRTSAASSFSGVAKPRSPAHRTSDIVSPREEERSQFGSDEPAFGRLSYSEEESQLYANLHKAHGELTNTLRRGGEQLEKKRQKYKKKLEAMKNFYETKHKALEQKCAEHIQDVEQLKKEKESLESNVKNHCKESAVQRDKIKQQAELLKQTTQEVATLKKKCAAKEKQCAELESMLAQAREEHIKLKEELEQKESIVKKLTMRRNLEAKEDLEKCLEACTEMSSLADSLENTLDEDQLQTLNKKIENKMKQLKTQRRLSQSWPR